MAEDTLNSLVAGLIGATKGANAKSGEEIAKACQRLVDYLNENPQEVSRQDGESRSKPCAESGPFSPIAKLAECLIGFGCEQDIVRREYGQALIDLGMPSAAISVLRPLAKRGNDNEHLEAKGLIGRANKDIYVKGRLGNTQIGKRTLQKALDAYGEAYTANKPIWHGINIAALLHRAKIDGLRCPTIGPLSEIASEVLGSIDEKERKGTAFGCLGLGNQCRGPRRQENWEEADQAIKKYVEAPDWDSFHLWGTLRQLEKVWKINSRTRKGEGRS